jgi:hypothetical protein
VAKTSTKPTREEIYELVSHLMAVRMDFVQQLLKTRGVTYSGLNKQGLRGRVLWAINGGKLTAADIAGYLDRVEPGGKQHVYLMRPPRALNGEWTDLVKVRRRLKQKAATKQFVDADLPLFMPPELELSNIAVTDSEIIVRAVEARYYHDRDQSLDEHSTTDDGLPVELRAFVQRVARSTVTFRWNPSTRQAALHITQATGKGIGRDHYREVRDRFESSVSGWVDLSKFKDARLQTAIEKLRLKEGTGTGVLTRSRRGRWGTPTGAELEVVSASTNASVYADPQINAAVGQVADAVSGQNGNLFWLPQKTNPLTDEVHLVLVAADARVHFMVPTSIAIVDHVLTEIRSLL